SSDCVRLTSTMSISSFANTLRAGTRAISRRTLRLVDDRTSRRSWRAEMPSIRDLVAAIRQRDGVDAAVVLGRDGLLIDSQSVPNLDAEHVAALVPGIVAASDEFGAAAARGSLVTAVLEYPAGLAIVSSLRFGTD